MNQPQESMSPSSPSARSGPRPPMFGPIHKTLRLASCEALSLLGAASSSDEAALAHAVAELSALLTAYESHLGHEERFVRPAAEARLQATGNAFDEHPAHLRHIAELRALAEGLLRARPEHRAQAKRTLYLHASTFIGESFVHMAEEEQVLEPLLERVLSPAEVGSIQGQIQASITPEERAYSARFIFRALEREERFGLLAGILQGETPERVMGMLEQLRPHLEPSVLSEMVAFVEASRGGQ